MGSCIDFIILNAKFDDHGLLPPGDYKSTLAQLRKSILDKGPKGKSETWDGEWRAKLVDNLKVLVKQLCSRRRQIKSPETRVVTFFRAK